MPADRAFERILLVLTIFTVALHVFGARHVAHGDALWGVHVYAFLPRWAAPVATILLLAIVAVSHRPAAGRVRRLQERIAGLRRSAWRKTVALCGTSLAAGAVFWFCRVRHTFLGDGDIILAALPTSPPFHPREPLAAFFNHAAYHALLRLAGAEFPPHLLAQRAVGLASVVAGMLFVPVAWALARELLALHPPKPRASAGLLAGVLLAQGYALLFFGYIENYTFLLLALGLHLWLALRFASGRGPFILPAGAALFAFAVHFSAAMLFPSLLLLAGIGLADRARRKGVLRDLGLATALLLALAVLVSRLGHGYDLFAGFIRVVRQELLLGGRDRLSYMFSAEHGRDFVQEQLLIGPLGLVLFLAALTVAALHRGRRPPAAVLFLTLCAFVYLTAAWFAGGGNLGYARNWDLHAPGGLVFTVAGFGLVFASGGGVRRSAPLVWALALSLYHTVPWIAVNMSEERGLARMKVLPLGGGRSEMVVGNYYLRHRDLSRARLWLEKSFEAYPGNLSTCHLLGTVYALQGETEKAVKILGFGLELRPTDVDIRRRLIGTLTAAGRVQEAVQQLATLVQQPAATADDWIRYGDALAAGGDGEKATAVRRTALQKCAGAYREHADYAATMRLARLHESLGEPERALELFTRAARANPDSMPALYACGRLQLELGRVEPGRSQLESIVRAGPDPDMQAKIDSLLERFSAPGR